MKAFKVILLVIISLFFSACSENGNNHQEKKVDPAVKAQSEAEAARYRELVNLYVGKKVPYEQFSEIGMPKTLSGTNNSQWVAYFPKANFTIVSDKQTDIVRTVYIGKREF